MVGFRYGPPPPPFPVLDREGDPEPSAKPKPKKGLTMSEPEFLTPTGGEGVGGGCSAWPCGGGWVPDGLIPAEFQRGVRAGTLVAVLLAAGVLTIQLLGA